MGYLDEIPKIFTPPKSIKFQAKDNFEELQNEGHDSISEDFGDSPFADRKPLPEEEI